MHYSRSILLLIIACMCIDYSYAAGKSKPKSSSPSPESDSKRPWSSFSEQEPISPLPRSFLSSAAAATASRSPSSQDRLKSTLNPNASPFTGNDTAFYYDPCNCYTLTILYHHLLQVSEHLVDMDHTIRRLEMKISELKLTHERKIPSHPMHAEKATQTRKTPRYYYAKKKNPPIKNDKNKK